MSLACTLGCSQKAIAPEPQPQATPSSATGEAGPWHMDLKVSPDHPRMVKPLTLTLHITDDHAQPANDAEVNGALRMKEMDMGTTQIKFAPKGNGDYEAAMTSMDMSGPWNLAVEASQGPVHAKKSFEFTVYD
ncbi:MAG: FixH family protein [Candidatus Korobacteraceae bacterium]